VNLREPGPILASAQQAAGAGGAGASQGVRVVRPDIEIHSSGGAGEGLVLSDLMPLRRTPVSVPSFPAALTWAATALALIAVVLGLLGVGSSNPAPKLGSGGVTVAGVDPAAGARVPLNLDHQIPVVVPQTLPGVGTPDTAQLTLSLGSLSVVRSTSVPFVHSSSGYTTTVDASSGRYIVGGKLAGSLRISGAQGSVTDDFGVSASRAPLSTFGGVTAIVLLLIVVAYTESLLRSLRRGRRRDNRTAAMAGLVVVGLLGGIAATLWGWALTISSPTLLSFILSAVIGAAAGLVAALAGKKLGERTRARRQSNRLVLVARRTATPPAQPAAVGIGS
jgi:hypothetical protein